MLKLKQLPLSCVLMTGLAAGGAKAQDCGEVTITEMDWASATIVTSVAKFLMETGYGCSVVKVPSASNPALASVAETGEPDILTEIWTNGAPAYEGLIADGKITQLTEVLSDGGVEGWWVPNYLLEKHPELSTLEGIKANPGLVGNRFHNCPEGWTCKVVSTNMAKAAGLADAGIEDFVHGSGETLATSIASAFTDEAPWFGYYWAPTSILGKYPMTMVDIGPHDPEGHACNSNDDCANPMVGAFPKSIVTTVVSEAFMAENPAVTDLMRNLSFTNTQMGEVLAWQEANNASADEAAVYYFTNYKDSWGGWLNDAAREKLAALLK
ncbi:glycine/betaine ABC transporter substrate-binding protein [Planktomarina sp.]|nr:glycine betaine ABC transporter substrate-binding protein [Planktomarina sp.]MDB4841961.1 glycine/betaine ABC transporter substrate-binding protein [Planktomarina sp.]